VKCLIDKPLDQYYPSQKYNCKSCMNIYTVQWAKDHPEAVQRTRDKWRAKNHDRLLAYQREYQRLNPVAVKARRQRWAAANPDRCRAHSRAYYLKQKALKQASQA
jgi:hypothetical protein